MGSRKATAKLAAIPAKISPPRLTETYRRERLFRAIDAARRKRTIWIAAPAGAGKTSLVTSYLSARRLPALWYNVDTWDADVANLFHYLAMAARAASPRRRSRIPEFKVENHAGVLAFSRGFFETLFGERPSPSVVVLDDYHEAVSELWDQVIREAVCALPDGLSAIVISRRAPPPSFAKFIACGDLRILDQEDLRLTQREMTGLAHLYRPDLRSAQGKTQVKRVCELANGWAAALTLLLQERSVGVLSAHRLEHCSERIFDYFATEVLDKMTLKERDLLLKTSVAPSFTAKLAECLTGGADTARVLGDLERRSFLTQRLGQSGSYRHHPLFREFLLRQAEKDLGAEALRALHRRAAESLVDAGLIDEAMDQLETANDVPARARVILRVAPSYLATGRSRTIETWIARLPAPYVEADGWLCYWAAICCVHHSPSTARERLEKAHAHFTRSQDAAGLYRTCAAAIQAVVHEGRDFGRLDHWAERVDRMRVEGPSCPEAFLPKLAMGMLIASLYRRRDPEQRRYWAEQAFVLAMQTSDIADRAMTLGFLGFYFTLFDDAARASATLEMLRATARAADLPPLAVLTMLRAEAACSWVRGDIAVSLSLAREGMALSERTGIFVWKISLHAIGMAAALALGDAAAAQEFLEPLEPGTLVGPPLIAVGHHYYYNASLEALVRGDVARSLHLVELALQSAEQIGYPVVMECNANLILASALFRAGRGSEALVALGGARRVAEEIDCSYLLYSSHLITADVLWKDDREQALRYLKSGLTLARLHNYYMGFPFTKALLTRTAERALEHQIEPAYVKQSIALHRLTPERGPLQLENWPWRYRLRALGPFEICRDDDAAASVNAAGDDRKGTPRGMPLRLLCAIVALGAREVRDISLIDALWPDADGDAGRRSFDTTLHRLRRQLGDDDVLRLSAGRISIDARLCWLDTWAAEELFAETERHIEHAASVPMLLAFSRRLLDLYRGPLLSDEANADWARGPRDRLATKFNHAVDLLGRALEKHGELSEAAALYRRVIEGDAFTERAYIGLVRCAVECGHRVEASRLFEQYRARLVATSDIGPSREMLDSMRTLLR